MFFPLVGFLAKNQKKFKVGKIRNNDEETDYFEKKKRFHLLKRHLYQYGKPENMLLVTGRLLFTFCHFPQLERTLLYPLSISST